MAETAGLRLGLPQYAPEETPQVPNSTAFDCYQNSSVSLVVCAWRLCTLLSAVTSKTPPAFFSTSAPSNVVNIPLLHDLDRLQHVSHAEVVERLDPP